MTFPSFPVSRRQFLQASAAAAAFQVVPRRVLGLGEKPPGEKLDIAGIGIGGQGAGDLRSMAGENIVALCDVDWTKAAKTFAAYPRAKRFRDYRVMLESFPGIDAVMVATPDHMHAPITMAALRAGKHVYVEKPMAHSIEECRAMKTLAADTGLVTQMGNNGHAGEGLRVTREWVQAGAIGDVHEIHCWSDRPGTFWKQGLDRPTDTPPTPSELDWDLWLGAAPERPYHPVYHPRAWRGWYDFGTGALGDMAIHNMDPAFYALDLDPPIAAEARTSPVLEESFPLWQIITLEFAAKGARPPVTIHWYDGGKMPPKPDDLGPEWSLGDNGIYFLGTKGTILCGGWSGMPRLFPEKRRAEFERPAKSIPRSPGHHAEWLQACKAGDPSGALAGFEYSAPFNESLLVGNLAMRLQTRIEWDAASMKAPNVPEAETLIRKVYRPGFGI